jgi:pyruvate dehydrogenase E2 component (dihydrolipoamide acetyltransferase)
MPIDILMPALSPTMTEGNLAKWVKKEGDKVKPGEVIAEIETDKATMEVEAVDEGVMGKIIVPSGTEGVKVNALIAVLLEAGEDSKALDGYISKAQATVASGPQDTAPLAAPATGSTPASAKPAASQGVRVFASPLAKRIAEQNQLDIGQVAGTGPHGRVVKADVEAALSSGGAKKAASAAPLAAASFGRNAQESIEVPLTTMRKVIAKRLMESKQTVPHFYLSVDCELDALLATRSQLNALAASQAPKGQEPAYKLSVNDLVIAAVARALRDVPEANASWAGDRVLQYTNVDVSVAVAIDGGLITPVIRNADQKPLSRLSNEMKDLATRARANKLAPEEFQGGGFSISNLGMYGIRDFAAIINPPQSCILAVGSGEERPVVKNGQLAVATVMSVTLSVDHRVVDGAVGAQFLAAFKRYIEAPVAMLA